MSHQLVRFFFCLLLLITLMSIQPQHGPLLAAASPAARPQSFGPPLTAYSYNVAGAPALAPWPAATYPFYAYNVSAERSAAEAYIDPAFQLQMIRLRSQLLASAARHNHREWTGMTDEQFATVMAAQLYFEYNSTLAQRSNLGRTLTPLYQEAQDVANRVGMGNFSVWPANLRPSVALSLLRGEMPYINRRNRAAVILYPITISGSQLQLAMQRHAGWEPALSAVANEIADPELAIEYLAANFEIATYRARFDWAPISWITFAGWHNRGLASPGAIVEHPELATILSNIERYFPAAIKLIYVPPTPAFQREMLTQ